MTYPQQQPGGWSDPSWPGQEQPHPWSTPGFQPAQPAYGYGSPAPARTNSLAIAALVLALFGIATVITAPIGAIVGHVSRRQIRQRGEQGDGMALAGIVVGWVLTAGWLLV